MTASLSPEEQPAFIALAERTAAGRYRGWADAVSEDGVRARLRACAESEDEIARRVEALVPGAEAIQRRILEAHPDLPAKYASLFEGRTLPEQFALQAEAERVGAATWRALAKAAGPPAHAEVFESCAALEEESAAVLEALVAEGAAG